jgi:5'-methylthioadenosine phosphorylase
MDGPAFSSRAESLANRQLGFDLIGMTNVPEAKLAREAEIALASLCMITDYDCWKPHEEAVNTASVLEVLLSNAENAKKILAHAIPKIPTEATWPEHRSLATAIATPRDLWPPDTITKLTPLLQPYL